MKKVLKALAFFFIGVGVSYFTFNHSIVNKKIQFNNEVNTLFDQNLGPEELNGKIFQLLFAYFAIDLQGIESKITAKIEERLNSTTPKVVEKVVEKIVYLPPAPKDNKIIKSINDSPEKEIKIIKNFRSLKSFEKLDFKVFLENASPILERDKAFEELNGTHKYIGNNQRGPNFQIDIENLFKLENKSYRGTSKINYKVLGKSEDAIIVDGMPLNFLKNKRYPTLVAARISKDRYILLNTADEFYTNDIKGILYIKVNDNFKKDGLLRVKSKN